MDKDVVVQLFSTFERAKKTDDDTGMEFWLARELQGLLGYARWENFIKVIEKSKIACNSSGHNSQDHFPDTTKMVDVGSGAKREIDDVALTRYACHLIAQNGDPAKNQIAFAQTYFAVQTRKMELIEQRLAEMERLNAREKLKLSEKQLSGVIYERLDDELSFGRIRSRGDTALFGGKTTKDMKARLARAHAVTAPWESGNVFLPHKTVFPWVGQYVVELVGFPAEANDDQVDATTQALNELINRGGYKVSDEFLKEFASMPSLGRRRPMRFR